MYFMIKLREDATKKIERRTSKKKSSGKFHTARLFTQALGPTQPPIQWVPRVSFPRGKAAGA